MTAESLRAKLASLVGKTILSIGRVHYVLARTTESDRGPIELTFSDSSIALFDVGPDGEALRLEEARWRDPFDEPLSSVNRDFVEKSGKWTAFDVSGEPPYVALIGQTVLDVQPILTEGGKITGTAVTTHAGTIRVRTYGADDVFVTVAKSEPP